MDATNSHGSLLGAIAEYTEALAQNPHSPVFVQLSEAYRQLGMADDALAVARTGVMQLPAYIPGHILHGRLLAERNDIAAAVVSFEAALSLEADHLPALKGLARLHYQQGNYDAARPLLLRAAALKPEDAVVRKALASLPQPTVAPGHGSVPSAAAAQKAGAPIATPTIAEIYERQGHYQRALGVYRDLLQKDPTDQELLLKYRQLKARIAVGVLDPAPPPVIETQAPVEESPPVAVAPPVLPHGLRVIQSLERMLEAVRRRREHVQ